MTDDIEQEQHHQNRPKPARRLLDRDHCLSPFGGRQYRDRAERKGQYRAQGRPQVSSKEWFGKADVGRQVPRIVRDIRREADLPDDPQ